MNKIIPEHMQSLILPFNWDVSKVWQLDAEVEMIDCRELEHL